MENFEWTAIQNNDASYDNQFWYAVKSTHIFCRPSCPSRLPKRENITIYYDPNDAIEAGYRPCKRCRPLNQPVDNRTWVSEINTILENNYQQNLSLKELAYQAHGSQSYLRHVYKQETGMTPQQKLLEIRMSQAEIMLVNSDQAVAVIGRKVGFDNPAYFIQKFRQKFGKSPLQYRLQRIKA
ncbi:bifunctional transcriptional activator/DNA repair enzyme AdaA [Lentilactobacillus sunkii]|jgi:AraC family transcriptional regulator of adaptative response / methylphosphotriester-DNA alkyltransferase methyltransferase|uniref:Bifunctional transcriptional activator/DNA repair enzyme AdaA n=1 Tax=Lentilactobacillus sunkii TaxID=481719 RepID=A0A1E7XCD0_9LACO|nr:Ada metal-binding domain-containing protein [Lentilactobacillus sunkii]OFA10709.1 bifunctional transcriptional activator/DNA repair enzyme AdaA [Lentilactobacillus sunkii]